MRNQQTKSTQFNCFSPPVMVATMVIEVALAIYTIWRYKLNELGKLIIATLLALAVFQFCEYFVCTGAVGHVFDWSRFGFVAITLLPALGVHLMHVLAGKQQRKMVVTAYVTMVGFAVTFLFIPHAFNNYQCTGNYVIFRLRPNLGGLFWVYYAGWLLTGMILGGHWANQLKRQGASAVRQLRCVQALIIGWLIFIVPTIAANVINPDLREGIPSIMCGFAVLFAVLLSLYIAPRAAIQKS